MSKEAYKGTVRLTVAQAIIRFLSNQYTERDGVERRLIVGAFGIFGHGQRWHQPRCRRRYLRLSGGDYSVPDLRRCRAGR